MHRVELPLLLQFYGKANTHTTHVQAYDTVMFHLPTCLEKLKRRVVMIPDGSLHSHGLGDARLWCRGSAPLSGEDFQLSVVGCVIVALATVEPLYHLLVPLAL